MNVNFLRKSLKIDRNNVDKARFYIVRNFHFSVGKSWEKPYFEEKKCLSYMPGNKANENDSLSFVNQIIEGACRVELCVNLMEGGTTPSIGLLQVIKQCVSIPIFVMIRPRGGDFCYSCDELQVMKEDIKALKLAGADGFVFGILTIDGEVNIAECQALLEAVRPLPATFHRAIDMTRNIFTSLDKIINMGFERVLSSGACNTALEGVHTLNKMVVQTKGTSTIIVPGAGITKENLEEIIIISGAREFHASARHVVESQMQFKKLDVFMGSQPNIEYINKFTCPQTVQQLVSIAKCVYSKVK